MAFSFKSVWGLFLTICLYSKQYFNCSNNYSYAVSSLNFVFPLPEPKNTSYILGEHILCVPAQWWWQEFPWGKELPQLKEGQVCERKSHWGLLNHRDNIQLRKSWAKNSWRPGDDLGEVSDMLALFLFFPKNEAVDIVEEKKHGETDPQVWFLKYSFYGWQMWFGSAYPDKVYFRGFSAWGARQATVY